MTTRAIRACITPGDYNILVPGHRDIDYREQVLIEHGVDTQVLTFTTPGVHVESPASGVVAGATDQRRLRAGRPREAGSLQCTRDAASERSARRP